MRSREEEEEEGRSTVMPPAADSEGGGEGGGGGRVRPISHESHSRRTKRERDIFSHVRVLRRLLPWHASHLPDCEAKKREGQEGGQEVTVAVWQGGETVSPF